eukprot:scaffold1912_cov167-Amphora_coffeaeformis.AAC.32
MMFRDGSNNSFLEIVGRSVNYCEVTAAIVRPCHQTRKGMAMMGLRMMVVGGDGANRATPQQEVSQEATWFSVKQRRPLVETPTKTQRPNMNLSGGILDQTSRQVTYDLSATARS